MSMKTSRIRIPMVTACILLFASALAAVSVPAHAATASPVRSAIAASAKLLPVNTVAVKTPGNQVTGPLSTAVNLPITAMETDQTALLTFTVTGLPTGFNISQPTLPGNATVAITGTFTTAFAGDVKVTATDVASGATDFKTFTWTAKNTITTTNPGTQTTTVGKGVALAITALDDDTSALPLTYTDTGKSLPTGLTINETTGVITGTPTTAGSYAVTVTVSDTTKSTATIGFTWNITNLVTVTAPAKEQSWLGVPVNVKIKATDSDPTRTLTFGAPGLPAGLTVNPATGTVTGTPTKLSVPVAVRVTATDGTTAGSALIKWSVGYPVIIPNPGKVSATVGQALNVQLSYTDIANAHAHVTLSATGLPRGLTFQQRPPLVYGWPATAGSYRVTIHAKDSLGGVSLMTFPLVVRSAPNSGPTGQIHLALGGKCLEDPANRTGNGTRLVIWNCQTGSAERWTIAADGTVRVHNHCLDIVGRGSSAGQPVQLWQCTGGPREIWVQGTAGELVNPASGLCLTDPGSSTRNGTVPTMGACRIRSDEAWTLPAQPVLAALGGKCIDDLHSVGTNGNVIDMYTCNGSPVQAWTFEPDGTLRMFGNKCITVRGPLGRVGTKIQLWDCTAANRKGQQWAVVRTGDLSAELTLGGVCLAIPSMTAADGSELVTARCTATDPRVHWHIW